MGADLTEGNSVGLDQTSAVSTKANRYVGKGSRERRRRDACPDSCHISPDSPAQTAKAAIIAGERSNAARARGGGAAPPARRCTERRAGLSVTGGLLVSTAIAFFAAANGASAADQSSMYTKAPPVSSAYDWDGFYVGGNIGYAWGKSNWNTPPNSGSFNLYQGFDSFAESGSFFEGIQAGYNHMFNNRVVWGAEADLQGPSFPTPASPIGVSVGGVSNVNSPVYGPLTFGENVLESGTVRGRLGYAPGNWLYYVTGGLAWSRNQPYLTNITTGNSQLGFLWRAGYAVGAGVEVPFMPHWTARLEYLYTGYPDKGINFAQYDNLGPNFTSNWQQQQVRLGVNYQFNEAEPAAKGKSDDDSLWKNAGDSINFHAQTTWTWQGDLPFSSPYSGPNSATGAGQGRETFDADLFAGVRLWQNAELWVNPELDQGFGLGNTHGFAAFPSAESYKLGFSDPYARIPRYFIRDTFDLGGADHKVDADINQFENTFTENRLVLTVGKYGIVDIFDTNKYANNPKVDFLNWAAINAGTLDYAGDAWGLTYGATAELYWDRYTFRTGIFDLSAGPAGGSTPTAYGDDATGHDHEWLGEIEERHQFLGQDGKLKLTGYLEQGYMGSYADAIAWANTYGLPANINAVRSYKTRPGVSFNMEQGLTDTIGFFARVGWADPNLEPWDFTDVDNSGQAGFSINGKTWGRDKDTIGIMEMVDNISKAHQEFLNAGGVGILVGDGILPHYGLEYVTEIYYSYALTDTVKVTADYQYVVNPGYNPDRGPVNVFAARMHWQY
jgi:high affinity Mn2+ porin